MKEKNKLFAMFAGITLITFTGFQILFMTNALATNDPEVSINEQVSCGSGSKTFSGTANYFGDSSTRLRVTFNPPGSNNTTTEVDSQSEPTNWSFNKTVTAGQTYTIEAKVWDNSSGDGNPEDTDSWTFTVQACSTPTPTTAPTATPTPSPLPTATPTPTADPTPSVEPTQTPDTEIDTNDQETTPSPEPTATPTTEPTPTTGASSNNSSNNSSSNNSTPTENKVGGISAENNAGGISTLAPTGTFINTLMNSMFISGIITFLFGLRRHVKNQA